VTAVLTYAAVPTGILPLLAVVAWAHTVIEGWLANRATDREIDERMNVPLPDARRELSDPTPPPYIAPVLGVRIGSRHPDPVLHIPAYEPVHACPLVAATSPSYNGAHRFGFVRGDTLELFNAIVDTEFPSFVESAA
jgi:hypothetical protein